MKTLRKTLKTFKWTSITGVFAAVAIFIASPFYTYEVFNQQEAIAELYFDQLSPQRFTVHLATPESCGFQRFEIEGDQWQLDASFLKWQGPAVMLGFESRYRLDRLSGRYRNVEQANRRSSRVYDLSTEVAVDLFALAENTQWVDAVFGSSVFLDMEPALFYRVYKTEDALIAKALARHQLPLVESSSNNESCDESLGYIKQAAQGLNNFATYYF